METENSHRARVGKLSSGLEGLFDDVVKQVSPELKRMRVRAGEDFRVKNHPSLSRAIDKATALLSKRLKAKIIRAIETEYNKGFGKGVETLKNAYETTLPKPFLSALNTRRVSASEAYISRCEKGSFRLSKDIWKIGEQVGDVMRRVIEADIRDGVGYQTMARDIKGFLKDPDRVFRRVRGEDGRLHLSRAARNYHCGRGVYRSSVRNAQRVARTETNIAYRSADCEASSKNKFVLGIRINLSANHTTKLPSGKVVPLYDICDILSEQDYPSWFKFTGWHPHCRCFITYILVPRAEALRMIREGLDSPPRSQRVLAPPTAFRDWLLKNADRLNESKSLPYFIRDNKAMIDRINDDTYVSDLLTMQGIDHTEQQIVRVDGDTFRKAILDYKEGGAVSSAWQVDVYDKYADNYKCFLTEDGKSGICVKPDGDIVSVFSGVSGDRRMEKLMFTAIDNGGVKCDCFASWLQNLYARYGGVAVGKVAFNTEYAPDEWKAMPEDWKKDNQPYVVAMIFKKGVVDAAKGYDVGAEVDMDSVREYDDYDEMINARNAMLE